MFWRHSIVERTCNSNTKSKSLTMTSHRRASAPATMNRRVIDVDDLAEERARRRSMKKRVSILFKSFRRHSHVVHKEDIRESHSDTSKTWDWEHSQSQSLSQSHEEDRGIIRVKKILPSDQDPFEAAQAYIVSSSSASLSSMSDHEHEHEHEHENDEHHDVHLEEQLATAERSQAARFLINLIGVTLCYRILSKKLPRKIKRRVSFATLPVYIGDEQQQQQDLDHIPHIPYLPEHTLPKDLAVEIVLFRWPLIVKPVRPPISQQLLQQIVNFDKTLLNGQEQQPQQPEEPTNTELVALQQKCADLSKITELLSKQLVESTLNKKRESKLQRMEAKSYQDAMRLLDEQHRAQCAALLSDKKYLEGQLRYCKVESVPPIVKSPSTNDKKNKNKQRRRSFMDDLKEPVQVCLRSPMSTRASFSMASTMILQNKLMPALLSAVARANHNAE